VDWRIFFIGPMGSEPSSTSGEGTGKTVSYREHLPKLHKYIVDYLKKEHGYLETKEKQHQLTKGDLVDSVTLRMGRGRKEDKITILNPFNLYGMNDIPANVFDAIDDSDLVVVDLSGDKPAVAYELAFAHALGIETILVTEHSDINFYLKQIRYFCIDFDSISISSSELNNAIDTWLTNRNKRFDSQNPLTKFYGAPLPDISAAVGLAAGFFNNFVRPILTSGEVVQREKTSKRKIKEEVRKLNGFIVFRPENFAETIEEVEEKLAKSMQKAYPNELMRGAPNKLFIKTSEGARTAFFIVKDYLIDIPRTMFSLDLSPRLKRIKRKGSLRSNMERILIERFFEAIKMYLDEENSTKPKRKLFHYGSLEEIPEIIERCERERLQ